MKFVISGGWSYGNIGDEVIFTSTSYLFEKEFKESQIVYTSYNVDYFRSVHHKVAISSVHCILAKYKENEYDYSAIVNHLDRYGLNKYSEMFNKSTIFVMSGGGYFVEEWKSQFISRLVEIKIAIDKGAKVWIIGQSIGPVITFNSRIILKELLDKCNYIAVRDGSTKKMLEGLGIRKNIRCVPDMAVIISDILPKAKCDGRIIGIMPAAYSSYTAIDSPLKNKFIERIKKRITIEGIKYKIELRKIISELVKRYKVEIVLSTQWAWDYKFAKYLCKGMDKEKIHISYCKSTVELCNKLSRISVLISSKMHPIIIASSYGLHVIGISYNFKMDDYMKMIGKADCCYRIDKISKDIILNKMEQFSAENLEISKYKIQIYDMMAELKSLLGQKDE